MSEPATEPETASPPALPDHAWMQLTLLRLGLTYRVATDGRYLVEVRGRGEEQRKPLCRFEPGIERISEAGLGRLAAALEASGFFSMQPTIPSGPTPEGLPNNEVFDPQPIVVTARSASGEVRSVTVVGDPVAPQSLGAMEPVLVALDLEAIGNWLGE